MAIATLPFVLPAQLGVTVAELTYFTITGFYGDIENPSGVGSSITPTFGVVSATVTFFPRVPLGTVYIFLRWMTRTVARRTPHWLSHRYKPV